MPAPPPSPLRRPAPTPCFHLLIIIFLFFFSKLWYLSPSQGKNEFDQFITDFQQLISDKMSQTPHFIIVTGDFVFLVEK